MNPLFVKYAGGIIRAVLASALVPVFNYLVAHGVIQSSDTEQILTWLVGVVVAAAWSLYNKHNEQQKLVVLAAKADMSEQEAEEHIAAKLPVPSVTTAKDMVPIPVPNP